MQRYTKIYTLQREKWNILRENPYFQTVFPYQRLFFSKKYTTFVPIIKQNYASKQNNASKQ
jgi:hypothetical protein